MILDTRKMVQEELVKLKEITYELERKPKLVIIRVGNDPASERYVKNKINRCEEVGIESQIIHLNSNAQSHMVEHEIEKLNSNANVDAILLQLPLPKHLDEHKLTNLINPKKDVDGFTVENIGKLVLGEECNIACTPQGIIDILKYNNIKIEGKDVLIINRSNIVGKPLAHLLLKENATVTIAHSKTYDSTMADLMWNADIVVTGVGIPNKWKSNMFAPKTTIIDVSINFDENGKMCGDVCKADYDKLVERGCHITPVPFGVGQVTVLELLKNTIKIYKNRG